MQKKYLLLLGVLTSCSATPENPDPHESFNRDMLELNIAIDQNILKPVAEGYKEIVPMSMQKSFSSFFTNAKEPYYAINYMLSGDIDATTNSLFRFVINSTFGFLGLFDVAAEIGMESRKTSYQEMWKRLEMPTGDYLMLPILASSSTRDAFTEPVSWFADPISYVIGFPWMTLKAIGYAISDRAENGHTIDGMLKDSMDVYTLMRDTYLQKYGDLPEESDDE